MTPYLDDLARATLPVAAVLVILAAAARAVLWARLDDERAQRLARRSAEPLAIWGLAAITVHALALALSATADALSLILLLLVALPAALLMRAPAEPREAPRPRPERPAPVAPQPEARPAARAAPAGSLWLHRSDEDERRDGALWSR
jgi:hypothetical protein